MKNNNSTNACYRLCAISKQKYNINELIKITYSKKDNILSINDSKIKGRSVYLKKENLSNVISKKLYGIVFGKLKITPNNDMINQLKSFFDKEI